MALNQMITFVKISMENMDAFTQIMEIQTIESQEALIEKTSLVNVHQIHLVL